MNKIAQRLQQLYPLSLVSNTDTEIKFEIEALNHIELTSLLHYLQKNDLIMNIEAKNSKFDSVNEKTFLLITITN